MNERQIGAFRQVMRLGSMTAAAHALSVSQPAVSRLIADLEANLGFALFERRAGKLFPTQDAHAFGSEVERMFYGLDRLERFAKDLRGLHQGALTLATLPMVSFSILPRTLARFLRDHAGLHVAHNVHTSPSRRRSGRSRAGRPRRRAGGAGAARRAASGKLAQRLRRRTACGPSALRPRGASPRRPERRADDRAVAPDGDGRLRDRALRQRRH